MISYLQTFISEYLIYHALTIAVLTMIITMIIVHHIGSEKNREIALKYKNIMNDFFTKNFKEYDGEMIVESPNIMKLYPSGR